MARKAAAKKRKTARRPKVTVHHLKSLSDKELSGVLKKAKTAKVGFVILNAPFKVRSAEPVA
jgi:hypothetical protein